MSSYALGITGYVLLLALAAGLVLASRRGGTRVATPGQVMGSIRHGRLGRIGRIGRVALVLGWWWLGWHLFVR